MSSTLPPPNPSADRHPHPRPLWKRLGSAGLTVIVVVSGVSQATGVTVHGWLSGRSKAPIVRSELTSVRSFCGLVQRQLKADRVRFDLMFDNLRQATDTEDAEPGVVSIFERADEKTAASATSLIALCDDEDGLGCIWRLDLFVPADRPREGIGYAGLRARAVDGIWRITRSERLGTCLWATSARLE